MKYMSGGSLRRVLEKVKAPKASEFWNPTGIAIIVCGIASGLEFIHSEHLIRRDIKPDNLLLDKRGHCRIGDFGSSKFMESGSPMSFNAATPFYQVPELWNEGQYTNKIDVFSFALVLYEILVGNYGNSMLNLSALADGERAELPGELSLEIRSIISRCWAQNPDDRPSFTDVLNELKQMKFEILAGVDGSAVDQFLKGISIKETKRRSRPKFTRKGEIAGLLGYTVDPGLPVPRGSGHSPQLTRASVPENLLNAHRGNFSSPVLTVQTRSGPSSSVVHGDTCLALSYRRCFEIGGVSLSF
jgi:serine/threonine protein kinase